MSYCKLIMFGRSSMMKFCPQVTWTFRVSVFSRSKVTLDKSKIPTLDENDLEEKFIKGGGPGGSKINKSSSCVWLLHKPSGISIKCQAGRELYANRATARERLVNKLDILLNGEDSIEAQKKRIQQKKAQSYAYKQKKVRELKAQYKELSNEK